MRAQLYSKTNILVRKCPLFGHESEIKDKRVIKMSFMINFITSG